MKPKHIALIQKTILTVIMVSWYVFLPLIGYTASTAPFGSAESTLASTSAESTLASTVPFGFAESTTHILYIFSHANIWHLAGNLFVLWSMGAPLCLLPSMAIAVLCSFLPAWGLWPLGMTVGFSGVIFAVWGIKWGRYCRRAPFRHVAYAEFCIRALPFALLGIVIPHINWCLHLYCLLCGLAYGRFTNIPLRL